MLKHFNNLHSTRVGEGLHDLDELLHDAILDILRNENIDDFADSVNRPGILETVQANNTSCKYTSLDVS
jgi:hypothetical protein